MSKHRYKIIIITVIVLGAIVSGVLAITKPTELTLRPNLGVATAAYVPPKVATNDIIYGAMNNQLEAAISKYPGIDVSVSYVDLSTGYAQSFGDTEAMTAASTTKLITATAYLHEVEAGRYSLNTLINGVSARARLQALINLSDNNAWAMFNNLLGAKRLSDYATSIGATSYNNDNNTIKTADIASLLAQLYTQKLLSPEHTKLLLSFMQNTSYESLIPASAPQNATVWHKYGELASSNGYLLHDAAIVEQNNKSYSVVIFTRKSGGQLNSYERNVYDDIMRAMLG